MSKQKFYLANSATLEISEEYLETESEYFDYCEPWRFNTPEEASKYLKEKLKAKINKIDKQIDALNSQRDELVNKLFNI